MNYRRASQVAEWAVVAVVIALHVVLAVAARQFPGIAWLQIWSDAQPFAVVLLVVAWVVLGPGWVWARITVAALCVAVSASPYMDATMEFLRAVAFSGAVGLVALCLRRQQIRVPANTTREPRPQYSILSLLVATTLIAVAVGGLEALRPYLLTANGGGRDFDDLRMFLVDLEAKATWGRLEVARGLVPSPAAVRQFVLAVAVAASALGGLATMLRPGMIWLRLVVLAIGIPAMAAYLAHLAGDGNSLSASPAELAAGTAAVALLVAVSVLPLRLMGYRLCRAAAKKSGSAVPAEREAPIDATSQHLSDGDRRITLRRTTLRPATLPQAPLETIR